MRNIYFSLTPHLHLLPEYSRLSPEPSVIECEEACSDLTHIDHRSILQSYIGSTISDSIYPSHVCKIESTLEVKWLRYDNKSSSQGKYLTCTNYRIKRTESGRIKRDSWFGDTTRHESVFHILGLIVSASSVVSWDENMSDLATFIELLRRLDTSREVEILLSLNSRARPEEESNLMRRYEIDIPIDSIMCLPPYNPPRQCEDKYSALHHIVFVVLMVSKWEDSQEQNL